MATDIIIEDVTTGTVDGAGIFDKLMVAVKAHIQEEFTNGRIKGAEYANVYLGVMQSVLAQSIEFALREKQTEAQIDVLEVEKAAKQYELDNILPEQKNKAIKENLILDEAKAKAAYEVSTMLPANVASTNKQTELYARQIAGFDDNKYQKLFEAQLNSWGLMYSSGTLESIPVIIRDDQVTALYDTLKP